MSADIHLDVLKEIVASWAKNQPRVSAAYVFGSRVKGTNRQDSDIDVAVELLTHRGFPGNFCDWAEIAEELKASLTPLLPIKLDLTQYENEKETPVVHKALSEASICVYRNAP